MSFIHIQLLTRTFVLSVAIGLFVTVSFADEVVLDGRRDSKVTVGDFDCSKCPRPANRMLSLFDGHDSSSLTAGQLWRFYNSQGVNSLDRLTLCLDIESDGRLETAGINSIELKIEDPSNFGKLLTDVSLKNNSLSIPIYDIVPFRPEANLEIELGYDFMQRFSAESKEKISLNVTGDASSNPVVSVQGVSDDRFFSSMINTIALSAFAVFWAFVFIALYRYTKPQIKAPEPQNVAPPKRQALSA